MSLKVGDTYRYEEPGYLNLYKY